jgi:hypothetical protein
MNGYPKIFNIESDQREEHSVAEQYAWVRAAVMKPVEYLESIKKHPNPPAANITDFSKKWGKRFALGGELVSAEIPLLKMWGCRARPAFQWSCSGYTGYVAIVDTVRIAPE